MLSRRCAGASAEKFKSAAAMPSVTLELSQRDNALALQPVEGNLQTERRSEPASMDQRITAALTEDTGVDLRRVPLAAGGGPADEM